MIKNFILLSILVLTILNLNAQRPGGQAGGAMANAPAIGAISGKIIEYNSKTPMQYVSVALVSMRDSSIAGGSITNDSGKFVINEVKYGRYFLVSTFMGYKRDTIRDIKITPNSTKLQLAVIQLKPSSKDLSEVEIVATKTYVEYKIDKKVVNVGTDISSAGGSAVQALENVPSVTVDIEGNVSLRGSSNFTVLIDGKPSPLTGTQALEQIPVGAIQSIEIITNPSAKYDPDGMSGIVNIIMKKNVIAGINGMVELSYGSYNSMGLNTLFSYRTKKFNIFAGADYSNRKGPGEGKSTTERYYGDTTYIEDNATKRSRNREGINFKAGTDFYLNDKNTFTLEGRYNIDAHNDPYEATQHSYSNPSIFNTYYYSESDGEESNNSLGGSLSWDHRFKNQNEKLISLLDVKTRTSSSDDWLKKYNADDDFNKMTLNMGNDIIEEKNNNDLLFKMDYTKPLKSRFDSTNTDSKFEAGFQTRITAQNATYDYHLLDVNSGEFVFKPDYSSTLKYDERIFSAYTTYGGMLGKSFGFLLGLRGEYTYRLIQSKNQEYKIERPDIFPTIHLSKKLPKDQQIMLSYSRRIERPRGWDLDPFPRYMSSHMIRIGNPELLPEYYNNFELSYQLPFKTYSSFSIEAYYRSTTNKITSIRSVDSVYNYWKMTNLDKDIASGLEGALNLTISKSINWNISGSGYYYQLFGNVEDSSVSKSSFNYNVRSNITWKFNPNGRIQLNGNYDGPSVTAQGSSAYMFVTSLSVRYDFFKKKLGVTLSVRDIFDTSRHRFESSGSNYYTTQEYRRAGRTFNLTLQYKINNYKQDNRRSSSNMGGDEGGGMEF